jgi:glutamate formiminotransferase/formiminotetrahydrofolate cyclodeaminase
MALVECVPNFSEGRDARKIQQITAAIEAVPGARLLNVEPGVDTNRAVVTFVGAPDAVAEAAFRAIAKAAEVIDMAAHQGAHPRIGATDVCPFVPVDGVTMDDCVVIARAVGERVGRELGVPVYLYEAAATRPERRNLADIRKGEYEGLAKKLADPAWAPDFGPAVFHARSGATVIGAREFLIAYNINLNSTDKAHASDIAFELREKGRVARRGHIRPYYARGTALFYAAGAYPCGECSETFLTYADVRAHTSATHRYDLDALLQANDLAPPDVVGKRVYKRGLFPHVKAIGWYVSDYRRAQISINLTRFRETPPHVVLEAARRLAAERGLVVTGSEIVGLVPYEALRTAGLYYLAQQGRTAGVPERDVLDTAITSLGLNDVAPFDPQAKILGRPERPANALVRSSVTDFVDEVSRSTPAPGGGSIAALAGALGAALASMVANLTHGKEGTEANDAELARIAERAQAVKDALVDDVDADTAAFHAYLEAMRLPRNTPEEAARRAERMQAGLRAAIDVPWRAAERSFEAMQLAREAMLLGKEASLSDAAVGVQVAFAAVRGATYNVLINLRDITDETFKAEKRAACEGLVQRARTLADDADALVRSRWGRA